MPILSTTRAAMAQFANSVMKRARIRDSYQAVFSTPDGQRVLQHICEHGFVFKSTFVRGDSHETALREGQRRLALSILRCVASDAEHLQQMTQEMMQNEDTSRSG